MERKALRAYLRRMGEGLRRYAATLKVGTTSRRLVEEQAVGFETALRYVLTRQKRYDQKPGGLGKR